MDAKRTIVAVRPGAALIARPRLFGALEAAFPVTFRAAEGAGEPAAALLQLVDGTALPSAEALAESGLPALALAADAPPGATGAPIEIGGGDAVDPRVRQIVVSDAPALSAPLPAAGEEVLARCDGSAAWLRTGGPAPVQRVRTALPELGPHEVLYSLLSRRPLSAIALLQFLREVLGPAGWTPPPLRAAIVFDDPNLHWRSYGFIDYRELVAHASEHGYHAVMAMIPLDAGWSHRSAVSLFRGHADRLSLVFHGNDHLKGELMQPSTDAAARSLTAQALRRVERFERRSGVSVDRVMMPPHGLCSPSVTAAVGALGFDALCAIHPLPWTADAPTDPPLAGWHPAQFVDGCPVIPRIPLTSSAADVALRAFLDHPVVLYGHHEDVAGGLEPLAAAAALVDRLGPVRWTSVGEIACSNLALHVDGPAATVRPFARRVRVDLPAGTSTIDVESPRDARPGFELAGWSVDGGDVRPFGAPAAVSATTVEIRLHGGADLDRSQVAEPAWRPWPRLRRAATETRDRILPLRR